MDVLPLRPGDPDRLSGYRLVGLIGEGGQGSVFLGEDDDGARVAVKLLHARFSGHPKARSRFAAELEVARRVAAFCTASILDADVEGDRPYIVSEYIDGPPLSQVIATEGPRTGAVLDRIAIGTITALAAIHEAGVVHRDFKPANVLLPADGPRVIDFGIARALDATGTLSSTAVGTPAYMAPEQISGARVGPEADVFAWGTTMGYAATGRAAFGQDSIPAVMHRILNLPPDLGALTDPLRDLVLQCLSKDPAVRPSSQQVLVRLLDLAGSLPQSGSSAQAPPAAMLTQGAAAASETAEGRLLQPPAAPHASPSSAPPSAPHASPVAPPALPPGFDQPGSFPPHNPYAAPGYLYDASPGHPYAQPAPGGNGGGASWPNGPTSPGAQTTSPASGPGGPGGPARPGGPAGPGGSRKRTIGVLAGVGSAALVALILAGSVIAVNVLGKEDEPTSKPGGQFSMIMSKFFTGEELNPSQAGYGSGTRFVTKQLFTGLTEVTTSGTMNNRLASRIAPADSTCTTWQIDVKSGTTFSNGEPVNAEAFVRGWTRAAQSKTSAASFLMSTIKGYPELSGNRATTFTGVQALAGQNRIDVTLIKPDCEFDKRLADPVFFPVPASALKADNETYNVMPVGNGPFKIGSYTRDKALTLVRNPSWGFGKAYLDQVTIRFSDDALTVGRTGIASGEYDWAEVTTESLASVKSQSGLLTRPSMSMNYLVPITSRGPMRSREARLAVSYALDRRAMSNTLYGGLYAPARGLVSPAIPGFARSGPCPSCEAPDPAKARQLAEQAGLKAGTRVTIYARELSSYRRWAELVQQQLQQNLGWSVDIKTVRLNDKEMRRTLLAKNSPGGLLTYGWVPDYPSAYGALQPLLGGDQVATETNGTLNYSGWRNEQFDQALANAIKDPQATTRLNSLQQAEKLALDDMALIPLWSYVKASLASAKFTGLKQDADGDPTLATTAIK
ncbi:ABC transporter substrate-binding protein [Actinomadura rudentiformis]|uniref:Protein kinase n=1 Tax=Actinomadura rudentiformis TaxID=359158 RepID=A0A6H9YK35_9ACTN|nr:ABC transporter substrate-binding protein [Actinomadura rudentiformis]KAB2346588.1 protein kinase [Actinomadura rudentiformis]